MSVTEAAGADQTIGRLPTATTGFVGRALRGPVNRATRVRSFAEYQQIFGGLWQPSMLAYAVEQYFDSGGREAVVVRVVNGGAPATITLPCGKESLQLEAVSPGSRETLRASVDYDNIGSNEDDRFNLVLQRVRTLGSEHIEDQEIFRRLSIEPGTTRFVVRALQESTLVRVRGVVPSLRPDRTFRAGARHPIGYVDSNPDGDDGLPLTDYDLIGSPDRGTGLFALRDVEDLHFLCIPPPARDRDVGPSLLLVAAQFCRERRALFIVDPPGTWETCDQALRGLRGLAFESENALMCFPRIQAFDKLRGGLETFANSAAVAGTFARMDAHHSPLDAAPDQPLLLRPGARPVRLLTDAEGLRLGAQGINPLQCVRSTARAHAPLKTLARGSAVGPDSVLLMARRRQLLTINSLEQGTRWARFEGGNRNSWPKLTRQVRAFLLSLAATGGLGKAAGTEFGEVVCDARLHSETDLLDGTVHVLVSLPTLRAGEFRAFMITHGRDGSQIRSVASHRLPAGAPITVQIPALHAVASGASSLEDTAPQRTLAQELFGTALEARAAMASSMTRETARSEAATARCLDLNLVARLYGEFDRRGQRF